jgi:serine/threonine-protein kinase
MMNLQIGSNIGDYQIVGILGAGGMGKVYKVRNVISDRIEAMKVLLPDLATEPELADRFLREIKTQASMEHPNIAALHTAIRVDNQLLMLMEFVEGVTLEQKLKDGPLPVENAVDYIRQVLSALDYAHQRGVIHRDIKPANMIVTPGGVVKLMDFGIAKATTDHRLTQTGTTLGSLYYMSPEQIQGAATLDGRADLYSVVVSLYELVTGKRPFDGDSQFAIMAAHLEKTPVPPVSLDPKLPALLNDIILMSVSKDPNARFQTAAAFRNGLGNVVGAAPAAAPAPVAAAGPAGAPAAAFAPAPAAANAPVQPAAPRSKRGLWMAVGAVATAAVVIGVIQLAPWKKTEAAPEAAPPAASESATPAVSTPLPAPQAAEPQQAAPVQAAQPPLQKQPVQKQVGQASRPAAGLQSGAPGGSPAAARKGRPTSQPQAAPVQAQQAPTAQPQPPQQQPAPAPAKAAPTGPSRAEIQAAREQFMMLSTRAGGVRSSLATMQRSQAASGLNLRGDMQNASSMMSSYLEGANSALNASDLASAKSFMDKAERQIEKLEKFLGR